MAVDDARDPKPQLFSIGGEPDHVVRPQTKRDAGSLPGCGRKDRHDGQRTELEDLLESCGTRATRFDENRVGCLSDLDEVIQKLGSETVQLDRFDVIALSLEGGRHLRAPTGAGVCNEHSCLHPPSSVLRSRPALRLAGGHGRALSISAECRRRLSG
jgi:hypothetical protein